MKKLISVLLIFLLLLGSVISLVASAALQSENDISARKFADEIGVMLTAVNEQSAMPGRDSPDFSDSEFALARLIVKSKSPIDTRNCSSVIRGCDDLWVLQFGSPDEASEAFDYYSTRAGIDFVETDKEVSGICSVSSDETEIEGEPEENSKYLSWGPEHIGIDRLNSSILSSGAEISKTVVAVIDTGVDHDHPFFEGRVLPTKINTSSSGIRNNSKDDNGHGTEVAGVIADCTLSNIYIKPYKVLDNHGKGTLISVAAGINCAVKDEVDVINISIGFDEDSEILKSAINEAQKKDILIVGAAGNSGSDELLYPASYSDVLKIAAVNEMNVIANFSNYGDDIDFAAPGVQIKTTFLDNRYVTVKGTSFAAPFVASVVAALISIYPNMSSEDIKDILIENAVWLNEINSAAKCGNGLVFAPEFSTDIALTKRTAEPEFSESGRVYLEEIDLEISCETPNSVIYYTTDRTVPSKTNPSSKIYDGSPIHLSQATVVLAVAYCDNHYRSSVASFEAIIAPEVSENLLEIDADGYITDYKGEVTCITVPDSVNGITVKGVGSGAFESSGLTEIILPDSVEEIKENAFKDCAVLKTIIAKNASIIGDNAFYNCIMLRNPILGKLNQIGKYSFFNVCSKQYLLTERTFSLELENLKSIPEGAFMQSAISRISLSSIGSIGKNAFSECSALVSIYAKGIVTMPNGAFKGCVSLDTVDISGLTYVPVGAFSTCTELKKVVIPNATYICSNAFENCVSLTDVSLNKAETVYSNAFSGCTKLITLSLPAMTSFEETIYSSNVAPSMPENLETFSAPSLKKTITDMFKKATKITNIYLNSADEIAEYTFRNCHNIYILNIESVEKLKPLSLTDCTIRFIDARNLISSDDMPDNSGILLSNNFIESTDTAENLTVYGTPGTFVEYYSQYKGYKFVPIPFLVNELPEYITENSESIYISAVGFDLKYQWYWNTVKSTEGGTPIDGATSNSYTFTQSDTAPYYYCVITQSDRNNISVIKTSIITKDTKPADYTQYYAAVEKANAIDRSRYSNIALLDAALSEDVSGRYSCEQAIVDAQTQAILDAVAALKLKTAEALSLYASKTELRIFQAVRIVAVVSPTDAIYNGIEWSTDNPKVLLVSKTGNVRCIGSGTGNVTAKIENPDGTVVTNTITIECELTTIEKILGLIFKVIFIIAAKHDIMCLTF